MKIALRLFLWMTFLTGVAYPLLVSVIAQVAMHDKAQGSLIYKDGKPIGSRLIAQKFESDKYFWPRPSAVDYNPLPSGGSNLGPTSAVLRQQVEERKERFGKDAPSDLLFASGSGLDPHLTPEAAHYQVERVAKARGLDTKNSIEALITSHTEGGFLGQPCVNVFLLNLALDKL